MIDPEHRGPRPPCPKCGMRMITTGTPPAPQTLECLRCGHIEAKPAGSIRGG